VILPDPRLPVPSALQFSAEQNDRAQHEDADAARSRNQGDGRIRAGRLRCCRGSDLRLICASPDLSPRRHALFSHRDVIFPRAETRYRFFIAAAPVRVLGCGAVRAAPSEGTSCLEPHPGLLEVSCVEAGVRCVCGDFTRRCVFLCSQSIEVGGGLTRGKFPAASIRRRRCIRGYGRLLPMRRRWRAPGVCRDKACSHKDCCCSSRNAD
jgi:hypothetical protein